MSVMKRYQDAFHLILKLVEATYNGVLINGLLRATWESEGTTL